MIRSYTYTYRECTCVYIYVVFLLCIVLLLYTLVWSRRYIYVWRVCCFVYSIYSRGNAFLLSRVTGVATVHLGILGNYGEVPGLSRRYIPHAPEKVYNILIDIRVCADFVWWSICCVLCSLAAVTTRPGPITTCWWVNLINTIRTADSYMQVTIRPGLIHYVPNY